MTNRGDRVGRTILGAVVICAAAFFASIGAMMATSAGYHWSVGALGVFLLIPGGYVVGTVLSMAGVTSA